MPNKNHSKSDKKTRKYKQRRAQLLAEAAQLKKETEILKKECAEQSKKSEKEYEELRNLQKETGKEIKEVVEGLRQDRIAAEKRVTEVKEVVEGLRQVRIASEKNGKRIGRIGNNLGRYTEAMATPSIRGILEREFNADFRGWLCAGGPKYEVDLEVDAWGVSRNGNGAAYVVEIKRKFHEKHIKQVWQIVKRFRVNLPEYRARAVYPMLAVVDISDEGRAMVWNAGIHLIEINDGVFRYAQPPQGFKADGYHGMRGVRKDVPHLRAIPG